MKDQVWQAVVGADQGLFALTEIAAKIIKYHPEVAGFFSTTQSIGMIHGGWKVNIVPGNTNIRITHRLIHGSSVKDVKMHLEKIVRDYAHDNLPNGRPIIVNAWDEHVVPANQSITLKALPGAIEPSSVSPFSVDDVTPYSILQGTTFAQYGSNLSYMAPLLMPANTDSRHYRQLSDHIFRFNPSKDINDPTDDVSGLHGAHRVDERVNMLGHVQDVSLQRTKEADYQLVGRVRS
ncbi:hypothetical protein N0V82_007132 [Gnomoniopsis sp. IMI 355080]|nr:hypothetical protein N0V82_007132 [Gnomoniopsis sp. IMI 355080]